jgi:hypothetical protein
MQSAFIALGVAPLPIVHPCLTSPSSQVCRERKVRCDGESECDNCRRSGETCIYVPTQTTTKADLARTISILQERLGKFINLRGQRVQFVDCGPWLTVGYSDIDKAEASIASQNSTAFARDSNVRRSSCEAARPTT